MAHLIELPYRADSDRLFDAIADRPWAMFLDSAGRGRFDIIVAEPFATLVTRGGETLLTRGGRTEPVSGDPLSALRRAVGGTAAALPQDVPFAGGALGYFAYDLAWHLDDWQRPPREAGAMPEMAVGIYDWALVVDHHQRRTRLVSHGRDPKTRAIWRELCTRFAEPRRPRRRRFAARAKPCANISREEYLAALALVRAYLRAGDCYQVNFAQTFAAAVGGDPWAAYRRLRRINAAPFAAYLNTPFGQVLSASPERFLSVRAGRVETRPIKGTRPRHPDPTQDRALAAALAASPKDRAENLMIVDLLRNDLGKCCATGSIRVPELFKVESFATVHHLVSTVTGRLAPGRDALHLLAGCFPGGSITGAPKRRAMAVIDELEPQARGLYCGAIGYLGFEGDMDTSIAIRTLVHRNGEMRFGAGGGVVIDSDPEAEYQESLDKAARLLALFEGPVVV